MWTCPQEFRYRWYPTRLASSAHPDGTKNPVADVTGPSVQDSSRLTKQCFWPTVHSSGAFLAYRARFSG